MSFTSIPTVGTSEIYCNELRLPGVTGSTVLKVGGEDLAVANTHFIYDDNPTMNDVTNDNLICAADAGSFASYMIVNNEWAFVHMNVSWTAQTTNTNNQVGIRLAHAIAPGYKCDIPMQLCDNIQITASGGAVQKNEENEYMRLDASTYDTYCALWYSNHNSGSTVITKGGVGRTLLDDGKFNLTFWYPIVPI